jgi:membrane associated rhomboid family serine protease
VDISDAAHLGGIIGGTIAAMIYYNRFTQKKIAQNPKVHL